MTRAYASLTFRGLLHAAFIGLAVIGLTALWLVPALNHQNPPPLECAATDSCEVEGV